jgi:hypothetical protein
MSQEIDDGGQAFPVPGLSQLPNDQFIHPYGGMTLRDYHAAHCPISFTEFLGGWKRAKEAATDEALLRFAQLRHDYADAMIAARKPKGDDNAA